MSKRLSISAALAVCTVLVVAASLRTRAADADKGISDTDKKFVRMAANGGLAEVQMGKAAETNASSEAVKKFGAHMVEDHIKANEKLMKIAEAKGIKLPADLHGEPKENYDRLAAFKDEKFNKEYIQYMVKDHNEDIEEYTKEAEHGEDADVKAYAMETLPILKEHLKMANEIAPKVGAEAHEDKK